MLRQYKWFVEFRSTAKMLQFSVIVLLTLLLVSQSGAAQQAAQCQLSPMNAGNATAAPDGSGSPDAAGGAAQGIGDPGSVGDSFTGIDAIILVDQSGSMGGRAYGMPDRPGTDPLGIRFETMQNLVNVLGNFGHVALANGHIGTVRLSAIGFGDPQQTVTLDWTSLPAGDYDDAQWETQRNDLVDLLSSGTFGARNFGYTNFEGALLLAEQQFNNIPALPQGQRNVRAIFIVTDGEPCAISDTDSTGNCINESANRSQLDRVLQLRTRAFPPSDYFMYFLGLETAGESFWDQFYSQWLTVIGDPSHMQRVTVPGDMTRAVGAFFSELRDVVSNSILSFPVPLANGQGSVHIPPYVRAVTFYVYKPNASVQSTDLTLFTPPPSTRQVREGDPDVTVENQFVSVESWTIKFPEPGMWQIQVPLTLSVEMQVDQIFMSSAYQWSTTPAIYHLWQAVPLSPFLYFNAAEPGQTPAPLAAQAAYPNRTNILNEYPITLSGCLELPDGTTQEIGGFNLTLDPNLPLVPGGASSQYTATFVPVMLGDYDIGLIGTVPGEDNPNPSVSGPFIPVDSRTPNTIQHFRVEPTGVSVIFDPYFDTSGGQWLTNDPFPICINVIDGNGQPLDYLDRLTVQVALQSGSEVNSVLLTWEGTPPSPRGDYCSYKGTITPNMPGLQQVFIRGLLDVNGDGNQIEVFNRTQPEATVEVLPVQQITLSVHTPLDYETTTYTNLPQPFFTGRPFTVVAYATDETGAVIDLAGVSGSSNPIVLTIKDINGNDITNGRTLSPVPNTKEFRLDATDMPAGAYTVEVTGAELPLRVCRCTYTATGANSDGLAGNQDRALIYYNVPVAQIAMWVVGSLLAVVLAYFIIRATIKWIRSGGAYPVRGIVEILTQRYDEALGWQEGPAIPLNLNDRKRNFRKYTPRNIPGLGDTPIKKIEITNDADPNKAVRGVVRMTAFYGDNKKKMITLTPGGDFPVDFYMDNKWRLSVWKDPGSSTDDETYYDDTVTV